MNAQAHLALCEAVAAATDRMLEAARRADWDSLVDAERQCAMLVERLRDSAPPPGLDDGERARKATLIRHMLANDAAVRDIAQPELARLAALLSPSLREGRIARAYGAGQAGPGSR